MKTHPPADLLAAAKNVIDNAYAPYSHYHVAASLRTKTGKIFAGCNIENASFSLTTCAETGAVTAMIAAGEKQIEEVLVLVTDDALCSPCGACRQRLAEHATPDTRFHLCTAKGLYASYTLAELLPHAFGPNNLHCVTPKEDS